MKHKQVIKMLKKMREQCKKLDKEYGVESCEHCPQENLCNTLYFDSPAEATDKILETIKEELKKL